MVITYITQVVLSFLNKLPKTEFIYTQEEKFFFLFYCVKKRKIFNRLLLQKISQQRHSYLSVK